MGSLRQVLESGLLEARPGAAAPLHGQGIRHRRTPEQQLGGSLLTKPSEPPSNSKTYVMTPLHKGHGDSP